METLFLFRSSTYKGNICIKMCWKLIFFIWCSLVSLFIPFLQCQVYSSHYKLTEIGLSSTSFVGTMAPSKMFYLSLNKPHSLFLPRSDLHSYTEFLITRYGLFTLNIFPTSKKKKILKYSLTSFY